MVSNQGHVQIEKSKETLSDCKWLQLNEQQEEDVTWLGPEAHEKVFQTMITFVQV